MPAPISPAIAATFPPPVMEARRWLNGVSFPPDRPLLNLSQAAPVDPPPEALRRVMAEATGRPETHLYGPVLGLPALREEIAAQWSARYGGAISPSQVAITSGCNQAFCAAMATIAQSGEAVILPTPWYFNHKMWLDTVGVETQLLPCGAGMLPDVAEAEAQITERTRAIVLISPNNPTGAEYPADLLADFLDLARARNIMLVIDETYSDFHAHDGAPHQLFQGDWPDHLIHLYSFSKVFRLTGHRVGAMIGSGARLAEAEKFLDSVAICPPQIGQIAALAGLRTLEDWVAGERQEILARRAAVLREMATLPDWTVLGCGAYFAYVQHPFDMASDVLAQRLVAEAGLLVLPGTMFGPTIAQGGDGQAERQLRIAFANADAAGIADMAGRLAAFVP